MDLGLKAQPIELDLIHFYNIKFKGLVELKKVLFLESFVPVKEIEKMGTI